MNNDETYIARPIALEEEIEEHNYEKNPPIGIDIGTSNCGIARWVNTRKIVGPQPYTLNTRQHPNNRNPHLMASWVFYDEVEDKIFVGYPAYKNRFRKPECVDFAIKRKIAENKPNIRLGKRLFSAVELTKEIVKGLLDDPIKMGLDCPAGLVATVPFYYHAHENYHTRLAVEAALEEVFANYPIENRPRLLDLLPEPVAAALNYAFEHNDSYVDRTILSFDMGGGTLDVTVFKLINSAAQMDFEVLATIGNPRFGGEDFDALLESLVLQKAGILLDRHPENSVRLWQLKIREAVVEAKERLSVERRAEVTVAGVAGQDIDLEITREDFESILHDNVSGRSFLVELDSLLSKALAKARVTPEMVNTILYIGGSSQIPCFGDVLKRKFPRATHHLNTADTLLGVVKGAAIYAAYLLDKQKGHHHNPFEKNIGQIKYISRTSHGLGLANYNGSMDVLIPANTVVPAKKTKLYHPIQHPSDDDKSTFVPAIAVYQGEAAVAAENTSIGTVKVPRIHLHGRSREEIEVKIDFMASDTEITVQIQVPQGNADKSDIQIQELLHL